MWVSTYKNYVCALRTSWVYASKYMWLSTYVKYIMYFKSFMNEYVNKHMWVSTYKKYICALETLCV